MNTKSICWLFLLVIALSYSGKTLANISMSHVWHSTTEQGDGLFAVTWVLTINNQGESDLNSLSLSLESISGALHSDQQQLEISYLNKGESLLQSITLLMYLPVYEGIYIEPMQFSGQALNAANQQVTLNGISFGELAQ